MSWILSCVLAVAITSFEEGEILAKTAQESVDAEALTFLQEIYAKAHVEKDEECPCNNQKKTLELTSREQSIAESPSIGSTLKIFMSFSIPLESWKDHSKLLEKTEGVFVLRGIPENSFTVLSRKIKTLRDAGINAPIQIDPAEYDRYHIAVVPTIVIEEKGQHDKIVGNIRLDAGLEKIVDHGSLRSLAATLLEKMTESSFSNVGKTQKASCK